MVHRIHGNVVFECDACGEELDTETPDFASALVMMRAEDWRARKFGQDWVHSCPDCQNSD